MYQELTEISAFATVSSTPLVSANPIVECRDRCTPELQDLLHHMDRSDCTLTIALQDPQNLVSRNTPHLRHTEAIPQNHTNLTGGQSSPCVFEDLFGDFLGGGFGPGRLRTSVRESGGRDTFSGGVHSVRERDSRGRGMGRKGKGEGDWMSARLSGVNDSMYKL